MKSRNPALPGLKQFANIRSKGLLRFEDSRKKEGFFRKNF